MPIAVSITSEDSAVVAEGELECVPKEVICIRRGKAIAQRL